MNSGKIKPILWGLSWGFIILYSFIHLVIIFKSAVDIPYLDEWDLFNKDGIVLGWTKDFILAFSMDHRIVLTKIVYLLNENIFHLNFRYQILFNVFCYTGLVFLVWKLIDRVLENKPSYLKIVGFIPFISTLPFEMHTRALATGKSLGLLALIVGTSLIFCKRSWFFFLSGTALLLTAFLSGSSGIAGVLGVCIVFLLWSLWLKNSTFIVRSLLLLTVMGVALQVWFRGFHQVSIHPQFTLPWTPRFFRFMAENLSLGFGFTDLNPYVSYLCFYLVLLALLSTIWFVFKNKEKDPQVGFLIALTTAILGMSALVTFGRGGFSLWQAKMSRYAEVSVFFPLLSIALFSKQPHWGRWGSLWVIILLGIGMVDNFDLSVYRIIADSRKEGVRCVQGLLHHPEENPSGICPTLYPYSITERVEVARKLGVSFTQNGTK